MKHAPEFSELFLQMIKPEEGIVGPACSEPVGQSGKEARTWHLRWAALRAAFSRVVCANSGWFVRTELNGWCRENQRSGCWFGKPPRGG